MPIKKPQLKAIGEITGIGGRKQIRHYLTQQFAALGFEPFDNGIPALAKFSGTIEGQQITVAFSILKLSKYVGINQDHQFRYRTFQGIRMQCILPTTQKTRLVSVKKTQGKWLKRSTNWLMRWRKFKAIAKDYLAQEIYSPDELFAHDFINDASIKNNLQQLTHKTTQCISWGLVLIPEQLNFNVTFANLDELASDKLKNRMHNMVKLVKAIENKAISQELSMRKAEILARDNPKKLMWRGLRIILLYLLLSVLLIGLLFFTTLKFGQAPVLILGIALFLIYKYV